MRKLLLVTVASLGVFGLSSCETIQAGFPNIPGPSQTLIDEKALLVAEASYFAAGTLIEKAVDSGLLTGDRAARVRVLNQQAYNALELARQAKAASNLVTYAEQTARVLGLIDQIQLTIRSQD